MGESRVFPLLLVAPALLTVQCLFIYPLGYSAVTAFEAADDEDATLPPVAQTDPVAPAEDPADEAAPVPAPGQTAAPVWNRFPTGVLPSAKPRTGLNMKCCVR